MRAALLAIVLACDAGTNHTPAPAAPAPVVTPPPPIDAAAAPVATAPPIARWNTNPTDRSAPGCDRATDRMIQYAELSDDARTARFCIWSHLATPGEEHIGCYGVDLASGAYRGEGGVWFSAPVPERDDDDAITVPIDDHLIAKLRGARLTLTRDGQPVAKLDVPKDSVLLAQTDALVIVDRDAKVYLVDHAAKITRTIKPPACRR